MRRKVEDEWDDELATNPKLASLRLLKEKCGESQCLDVADKGKRRHDDDQRWDSPTQD